MIEDIITNLPNSLEFLANNGFELKQDYELSIRPNEIMTIESCYVKNNMDLRVANDFIIVEIIYTDVDDFGNYRTESSHIVIDELTDDNLLMTMQTIFKV